MGSQDDDADKDGDDHLTPQFHSACSHWVRQASPHPKLSHAKNACLTHLHSLPPFVHLLLPSPRYREVASSSSETAGMGMGTKTVAVVAPTGL